MEDKIQATAAYAWATASYLAVQASVQIFAPGLLASILLATDSPSSSSSNTTLTALEAYHARSTGFVSLTLAIVVLLLTGAIPVGGTSSTVHDDAAVNARQNALATATTLITTLYHFATAFDLYAGGLGIEARLTGFGARAGMVISGALFCFGVWVVLFGGEAGKVSKTTGADKRTSGFPFSNSESAREKKKALKRG